MKKIIKDNLGYGFLPSFNLIMFLYIGYFSISLIEDVGIITSISILGILYIVYAFTLKYALNIGNLLFYLGFKFLPVSKRIIYFSTYYLVLLAIFKLVQPNFIDTIGLQGFLYSALLLIIISHYAIQRFKLQVLFIKISPRLYVDLVIGEVHKIEDIQEYDVIPVYENSFDLFKVDFASNIYEKLNSNKKSYDFYQNKIEKLNVEIKEHSDKYIIIEALDNDNNLIWKEDLQIVDTIAVDKSKIEDIKKLENI